jgi:hypothetical protein
LNHHHHYHYLILFYFIRRFQIIKIGAERKTSMSCTG